MRNPNPRFYAVGRFLAMLAIVVQVAFGAAVHAQPAPGVEDLLGSTAGGFPICHSGTPGTTDDGPPTDHSRHGMQCALCPACHALGAAAVLPVPASAVPVPFIAPEGRHSFVPPARGPPVMAVLAATYPTGPPLLA